MARGGIDGVSKFFGMRWESADVVRMAVRPELINAAGLLSGAATYALVDYCMGSALWRETTEEESIATVSISINYVATAPPARSSAGPGSTAATAAWRCSAARSRATTTG